MNCFQTLQISGLNRLERRGTPHNQANRVRIAWLDSTFTALPIGVAFKSLLSRMYIFDRDTYNGTEDFLMHYYAYVGIVQAQGVKETTANLT